MVNFKFPKEEELTLFLNDILEDEVDEKYYLSDEKTEKLLADVDWDKVNNDLNKIGNVNPSGRGMSGNVYLGSVSPTITTNKGEGIKMAVLTPDRINKRQNGRRFKTDGEPMFTINTQDRHGILQINNPKHSNDRVYLPEGISPTLNTMQGGDRQPFILVKNATKRGYLLAVPGDGINLEQPNSKTRRGRVQPQIAPTLQCNDSRGVLTYDLTIRKLTPKECFRLMGFLDDGINLDGLSNYQRYRLAGNGWDINLVSKIFKEMQLPDNLKTFPMFAGYGGESFALKKIGKPFKCIGYSEIDPYAIQCYNQNHKQNVKLTSIFPGMDAEIPIKNYGDCTKINPNELDDFDLLTGGFPCQSFSVAGKGLGESDPRGTLFWDIIRVAEVKKPKYMLLENVKGLTNKKHKQTFDKILSELDRIGYDVYWKICNSKLHGIPQNRDRIFFVCFRKELNYVLDSN